MAYVSCALMYIVPLDIPKYVGVRGPTERTTTYGWEERLCTGGDEMPPAVFATRPGSIAAIWRPCRCSYWHTTLSGKYPLFSSSSSCRLNTQPSATGYSSAARQCSTTTPVHSKNWVALVKTVEIEESCLADVNTTAAGYARRRGFRRSWTKVREVFPRACRQPFCCRCLTSRVRSNQCPWW